MKQKEDCNLMDRREMFGNCGEDVYLRYPQIVVRKDGNEDDVDVHERRA